MKPCLAKCLLIPFYLTCTNVQEELLHYLGVGFGSGGGGGDCVRKMLKYYFKDFYVIGKALSKKLSCMWTGVVL